VTLSCLFLLSGQSVSNAQVLQDNVWQKSDGWTNFPVANTMQGIVNINFDVRATSENIDGVVAITNGPANNYKDLALIFRMNSNGSMDVRDGDRYAAEMELPYEPDAIYSIEMDVNFDTHLYDVYVTYPSGQRFPVRLSAAFRSTQPISSADHLVIYEKNDGIEITDFRDNSKVWQKGDGWTNLSIANTIQGIVNINFDVRATSENINGVVAITNGPANKYDDLALIFRMNTNGLMDVRDGDTYASEIALPYEANAIYSVEMDVNFDTHLYDVYLTYPSGQRFPVRLGAAFRSTQPISSADHLVIYDQNNGLEISDFKVNSNVWQKADGWTNLSVADTMLGNVDINFDVRATSENINGVVAITNGLANNYDDLALIFRMNTNGLMDVRDGDTYASEIALPYEADAIYSVEMDVNFDTHLYDVFVTYPSGQRFAVRLGAAFRSSQPISSADHLVIYEKNDGLEITNLRVSSDDAPVADEPLPIVESIVVDEPLPIVEPVDADEPLPIDEPVVADEPLPIVEPVVADEPLPIVEPVVVIEPLPIDDTLSNATAGTITNPAYSSLAATMSTIAKDGLNITSRADVDNRSTAFFMDRSYIVTASRVYDATGDISQLNRAIAYANNFLNLRDDIYAANGGTVFTGAQTGYRAAPAPIIGTNVPAAVWSYDFTDNAVNGNPETKGRRAEVLTDTRVISALADIVVAYYAKLPTGSYIAPSGAQSGILSGTYASIAAKLLVEINKTVRLYDGTHQEDYVGRVGSSSTGSNWAVSGYFYTGRQNLSSSGIDADNFLPWNHQSGMWYARLVLNRFSSLDPTAVAQFTKWKATFDSIAVTADNPGLVNITQTVPFGVQSDGSYNWNYVITRSKPEDIDHALITVESMMLAYRFGLIPRNYITSLFSAFETLYLPDFSANYDRLHYPAGGVYGGFSNLAGVVNWLSAGTDLQSSFAQLMNTAEASGGLNIREEESVVSYYISEQLSTFFGIDEPVVVDEPLPIVEPVVADEPLPIDEPVVADEPLPIVEPVVADEPLPIVCQNADGWTNLPVANRMQGIVNITFDVRATSDNINGVVAIANGPANNYDDLALIFRMNTNGLIDTRDGDTYASEMELPYEADTIYSVEMDVDFDTGLYDVFVTYPSGQRFPVRLAAAFRSTQSISSADHLVIYEKNDGLEITDFKVNSEEVVVVDTLPTVESDVADEPLQIVELDANLPRIEVSNYSELMSALGSTGGGGVIYVRSGTYGCIDLSDRYHTREAPLLIEGIDSDVVFNGNCSYTIDIENSSYIAIRNLAVTGGLAGVNVASSAHVIFDNLEVSQNRQAGIHIGINSSYVDVVNSHIHDTGTENPQWAECIYVGTGGSQNFPDETTNVWVENNELYNCGFAEAVNVKAEVFNTTVKGNRITNISPGSTLYSQYNQAAITIEGGRGSDPSNNHRPNDKREVWVENNTINNVTGGRWNNGIMVGGTGVYVISNSLSNIDESAILASGYGDLGLPIYVYGNSFSSAGSNLKITRDVNVIQQQPPSANPNQAQSWLPR
jgi:hypothetical protein